MLFKLEKILQCPPEVSKSLHIQGLNLNYKDTYSTKEPKGADALPADHQRACFALLPPPSHSPCSHLIHLTRRLRLLPWCFYGLLSGLLCGGSRRWLWCWHDPSCAFSDAAFKWAHYGQLLTALGWQMALIGNLHWWDFACRSSIVQKYYFYY